MNRRWAFIAGLCIGMMSLTNVARAGVAVGQPAPAFTLTDSSGESRSLSDFAGSWVVLEWVNPDCPFVRKHYDSGNIQRLQATYAAQDVVWLSVNSSAPGKQGHLTPESAQAFLAQRQAAPTALLLDSDGAVGRLYGAKTTPHMFIINPEGIVAYNGAIDDRPSVDPDDVDGATNYVMQALAEAQAGQPVSVSSTQPYGCSVKY